MVLPGGDFEDADAVQVQLAPVRHSELEDGSRAQPARHDGQARPGRPGLVEFEPGRARRRRRAPRAHPVPVLGQALTERFDQQQGEGS